MVKDKKMNIVNYLDGVFVEGKAERPGDLSVNIRGVREPELVHLKFNHPITELALLPGEAQQLAESLLQAVECTGYLEEDG